MGCVLGASRVPIAEFTRNRAPTRIEPRRWQQIRYADVDDQRDAKDLVDDFHKAIFITACEISLVSLAVSSPTLHAVREAIQMRLIVGVPSTYNKCMQFLSAKAAIDQGFCTTSNLNARWLGPGVGEH